MAVSIRGVEYFYLTVKDVPGTAYSFLNELAAAEVNLLAFHIVPTGLEITQLTVFPENSAKLKKFAKEQNLSIAGPNSALLIQGDDKLGALVDIHQTLAEEDVNVFSSSGVASSQSGFGYIMHVRESDFKKAIKVLDAK